MRRLLSLFSAGFLISGCSTLVEVPKISAAESSLNPQEAWKSVVASYVDEKGRVDFQRLSKDPSKLRIYVNYIAKESPKSSPAKFSNPESVLAYYLNSYNALSMYNILDSGIPESLGGLKKVKFFYFKKFTIGGETMSLYTYENDIIRKVGEERVHFALNCMSGGCPRLPRYPFPSKDLAAELEKQAKFFFNEERNVQVDATKKVVRLSEILSFFTEDFLKKAPNLIAYVNKYRNTKVPEGYEVEFIPYDWTVNAQPKPETKVSNTCHTVLGT